MLSIAGRPPKEGIDYSGWAVDIFDSDPKIDKLMDAQGTTGFTIYFYMCQRAYGAKGYYYPWSYDDAATTALKIGGGVSSETVRQTIALCLKIGLFEQRLFLQDGILTSGGIQKRYWQVAKDRSYNLVNPDYWLLEEMPLGRRIECRQKADYGAVKKNNETAKGNIELQKESKQKQKKEDEFRQLCLFYTQNGFGNVTLYIEGCMRQEMQQGVEPQLIQQALCEAVENNKKSWRYTAAILRRCKGQRILTREEYCRQKQVTKQHEGKSAPAGQNVLASNVYKPLKERKKHGG